MSLLKICFQTLPPSQRLSLEDCFLHCNTIAATTRLTEECSIIIIIRISGYISGRVDSLWIPGQSWSLTRRTCEFCSLQLWKSERGWWINNNSRNKDFGLLLQIFFYSKLNEIIAPQKRMHGIIICSSSFRWPWPWCRKVTVAWQRKQFRAELSRQLSKQ